MPWLSNVRLERRPPQPIPSTSVADPTLLADERLWLRVGTATIKVREVPVQCSQCEDDSITHVDHDRDRFKCSAGHQQEFVACHGCRHVIDRPRGQRDPASCPACGSADLRKATAWDWYAQSLPSFCRVRSWPWQLASIKTTSPNVSRSTAA
jgi:hypothetical protein